MYCLFCVVLCIVCAYMCTELLPPGDYPIAVKYIITYRDISYHMNYQRCSRTCCNRLHSKRLQTLWKQRQKNATKRWYLF